jgi:hypothetical protein
MRKETVKDFFAARLTGRLGVSVTNIPPDELVYVTGYWFGICATPVD